MVVSLFVIASATFWFINLLPGDPISNRAKAMSPEAVEAVMKKYRLNQPLYVRYGYYLKDLIHGDLGQSITKPGVTVNDLLKKEFPVSCRLGLQAVAVGLIIGLPLGVISAFKRSRWQDYTVIIIALIGISIPGFVMAVLLQGLLGGKMGLPFVGWASGGSWLKGFGYTILPTIALSFSGVASNARFMRTSVLDIINQDYVLMAKAKGASKIVLVTRHILRNAILPVVTILGPRIASIITGTIVVESIFAIPGFGRELVSAISARDYTVVMSLTVFIAFLYIVSLLIVDIAYVLIDPRIRLQGKKA
jgi:oligopeptide transport system permease protein